MSSTNAYVQLIANTSYKITKEEDGDTRLTYLEILDELCTQYLKSRNSGHSDLEE